MGPAARWGPASQPAVTGPMEVLETSASLPSPTFLNQPPPDEPPVIVQPMRYIVGVAGLIDSRPGRSTHLCMIRPSYGGAAG